ncbi:ArsR family transcriptional regulator [Herbidospora cretacea]|uniref:ArsR family transcriptional regulator n=1 Tax=Herbidospora cretacea TaxID=28444 RepID=UPI00077447B4|nr:ArsR family transcriptional regulator [Herbidospora cretacea]
MGWWQVGADTLARSRFVVSPLAETTACMFALGRAHPAHPGERPWFERHADRFRTRLAGDPIDDLLIRAANGPEWVADFLVPTPAGTGEPTFADEVAAIRATPPDVVYADLEVSLGRMLPGPLRRADLAERAASVLEWVWTEAVEPTWDRRRRILEADIIGRVASLSMGGWEAALNDMRPGMRWLGDSRLQINTTSNPPRDITTARLMFVPVTPRHRWVSWEHPHRYAVIYPASGVLTEVREVSGPLARLLGSARATVLVLLDQPKSTTQLVALTGQGLGSVGRHLKVLLDAGLVERRRAGKSVLYYRSRTGDAVVTSSE